MANTIDVPTTINAAQCVATNSFDLTFFFSRTSSKYGDLFYNDSSKPEYRYNSRVDQLSVLVPAGITFVPGSAKAGHASPQQSISDPTIEFSFDINGNQIADGSGAYDKYTFVNNGATPWKRRTAANGNFDVMPIKFAYYLNNLYRTYNVPTNKLTAYPIAASGQFSLNFDTTPRSVTPNTGATNATANLTLFNYAVTSTKAAPSTVTNTADWNITITNQSSGVLSNFWIALEVPNKNIVFTSLTDGTNNYPLVSYGGTNSGKYWAQVGDIPVSSTGKAFTLVSNNFSVCGTDNFNVKTSFECYGYPIDPDQGFAVQGKRKLWTQGIGMSLSTQNPQLIAESSVDGMFNICDPIDEILKVTNGANGYAYKLEPEITFPTGMTFQPNSFIVRYKGVDYAIANPTLVSGSTYKVNIYTNNSLPFLTSGLPGTTSTGPGDNFFELKYKLETRCYANGVGNYISGSRISYVVNAESGCKKPTPATALSSKKVLIGGAPVNKVYNNTLVTLENPNTVGNHHVNETEELQVTIINQGYAAGALETIKVFVDPAYDYDPSSYVLQNGNTFTSMPAVNEPTSTIDISGQRVIQWEIPNGFTSTTGVNTIQFNFKVKVVNAQALSCTSSLDATMNTYVGGTASCSLTGETCNMEFPTGVEKIVTLKAFKPSITGVVNSSKSKTNGANVNFEVNYTITNTNATYEVKPGMLMKVYKDLNANGVLDAGEPLVTTSNPTATTVAINPSNGTLVGTVTGSYPGSRTPLLVSFESNDNVSNIWRKSKSITSNLNPRYIK